ncbi:hypothetical protein [Streptomyces sp. NPDC085540]|uniref:hypothetical protein n=1 Tax=Streptomyces sp. NPDC085540 TaxID=3365730 RepID=UPI0037D5FB39
MDPAWAGHPVVPVQEAVRHLGEIGAPAAGAVPLLGRILAQEERLGHPFERIRILADGAYVRTLTEALDQIAPGAAVGPVPAPSKELVPVPAPARRRIFGFGRPI